MMNNDVTICKNKIEMGNNERKNDVKMGNNGLTKAESCFSPKCCFREPVPCLSTVQLPTRSCSSVTSVAFIVSFQVLYFNLPLYSRHTKLPDRNGPEARSAAAPSKPATVCPAGQRARPRRRRRPRPASSWPWRRWHQRTPVLPRPSRGQRARPRRWSLQRSASSWRRRRWRPRTFASRCRPRRRRPPRPCPSVAIVDNFFATAVPAGGALPGHVCVGNDWPLQVLFTAEKMSKAYQIMPMEIIGSAAVWCKSVNDGSRSAIQYSCKFAT